VRRCLIVVLTALLLASCTRDPNKRKLEYLASGEKYFKSGKFQEAVVQFRNAIQIDPNYAESHYQLGRGYLAIRNPEAAFKEITQAVTLQPGHKEAQVQLAALLIARREFDKASAALQRVLEQDPNHVEAHAVLAQKYAATRDLPAAIGEMETAIRLAPARTEFYTALSIFHLSSGQAAKAEEVLKSAIAANPKSLDAVLSLAQFYYRTQRKLAEAEAQARAGIALDPKSVFPRVLLGEILTSANRLPEAEQILLELRKIAPDNPTAYNALALFYESTGQKEKAVAELQARAAEKPKDFALRNRLVVDLIETNRLTEALALNDKALKDSPKDPQVYYSSGRIFLLQGNAQAAVAAFQKAVSLQPNAPMTHYLLGNAQAALGMNKQARESFSKALELQPRFTDAAVALAGLAIAAGDPESALKYSASALEIAPGSVPATVTQAQAFLAKGDFKQAEASTLEALKADPNSIPALALLLDLRARQGKAPEMVARLADLSSRQPANAGLHLLLAVACQATRDLDRAETEARAALKLNPKIRQAHTLLAAIAFARNQSEPAKAELRLAIESDPRNLLNYLVLASQYEKESNWTESIKTIEKARLIDPESPLLANQLSYLYLEHGGDANVALNLAQMAKQKLPNSPNVADTLGWAYYKRGMYDQAITQFKQALQAAPQSPTYHYHLGLAYLGAKNPAAARQSLEASLKLPNFKDAPAAREALGKIPMPAR
jgi:tetratricopeptide (TPR) repeat protein